MPKRSNTRETIIFNGVEYHVHPNSTNRDRRTYYRTSTRKSLTLHIEAYKFYYGEIPEGKRVKSVDGNYGNIKKENLFLIDNANEKHRGCGSVEFDTWCGIKGRCYNEKSTSYKYYGARGIKMCDSWVNSFENFYADVGPRPSNKHSLDRIDNDGDYSPENCRWATRIQQARNKSNNVYVNYKGKKRNVTEVARLLNINPLMVHKRIRRGWPESRLFEKPRKSPTRKT